MDLRHLRYFSAVAEERHFGRAARRLRIAQPPLSRQIQALEAELGFSLFDRSSRHVRLTPAGEALFAHVHRVFDAVELATSHARRAAAGKTGRIVVGYPSSVAFSGLVELLRAFRARSPDVEVVLRELPPQEQLEWLLDGRLDVGFIRAPIDQPELERRVVRRETLVVALPETHPLANAKRKSPIHLSQLAREPFVSFPRARGPAFFDMLMRLCHDAGFTPRIVQEAPQLDLVSLVAAGFGVAIMPGSVRAARRPGVVFRPIHGAPRADLLVVWPRGATTPVVSDFLDVTEANVGKNMSWDTRRLTLRRSRKRATLPS
jgi:DNA-binding transcriptional LysR family regulator